VKSLSPITFRDLSVDDHSVARRLVATAFAGEPFATGMFGGSAIDRLSGMIDQYQTWPWAPNGITIAAAADGAVVGVAVATRPGQCALCDEFDDAAPDAGATHADQVEHEFQIACRAAHIAADLPPHAHITTVAIDPFLHGCGVGALLVDELLGRVWSVGARCAVLECLTTREAFYVRFGFRRVVEFADPGGPDLRSVLMFIDAPG
jgi:GNAT superfamily N-acetyltransferase